MESSEVKLFLLYIVIAILVVKYLLWLWTRRHFYAFMYSMPGPIGIPFIGDMLNVLQSPTKIQYLSNLFDTHKRHTVCAWITTSPKLLTCDPEVIQIVCSSPNIQEKSKAYEDQRKDYKGGLPFLSSNEWQYKRKMLNPSFKKSNLSQSIARFNSGKDVLIAEFDALTKNGKHKINNIISYVMLKTSLESNFDTFMGKEEICKLRDKLLYVLHHDRWHSDTTLTNFTSIYRNYRTYNRNIRDLNAFAKEMVSSKMSAPPSEGAQSESSNNNVISLCLDLFKRQKLSLQEIASESLVIILASFDTTAFTIYSVLLMLAMYPDVQERLFEEISNNFPDKNFDFSEDDLNRLPYLNMVINETLRLIPAGPLISRTVTKETLLNNGQSLPKDLQVCVSIFHLHRHKDMWGPDSESFNPERFSPENSAKINPHAFIPFSKGSRNCIGWRFAIILSKIVLAGLIRTFRYETDYKFEDLQFDSFLTMRYVDEPSLVIHQRS